MKKIAVICAYPAGENPGMLSVDLAFDAVVKALPEPVQIDRFCLEGALNLSVGDVLLNYLHLSSVDQLAAYEKIVYWGDFLHWIVYFERDILFRKRKLDTSVDLESCRNEWFSLMLLEGMETEFLSKVIVYGSTIYGLSSAQLTNSRYSKLLARFYTHASLVLMRDMVSSHFVSQLARNGQNCFGTDCALLLDSSALPRPAVPPVGSPYLLCSFGRSGANRALMTFAAEIARRKGLLLLTMDWLGQPSGINGLAEKLAYIKGAQLVVTDIYHMGVTAWREKVMVIGIGQGASSVNGTLSDKKKEIFFRQILASDNHVYLEDLLVALGNNSLFERLIKQVLSVIEDRDALQYASGVLDRQIDSAKRRLSAALLSS
ncbi:MAG: polysaccharide pyruvyl transferase family protein [Hydrogenophaga sp.]